MPMNFARTALLLALLTVIFVAMGALLGGQGGMVVAFVVALVMNLFTLWKSDRMILKLHGAKEVDANSGGQFYAIIRELAERAELPMPRVYVMQNPQPNAFATGRNPANAAVCASSGLLDMLSAEEAAGVMAHELAHVKNRDTITMTVAASIGGAISMMAQYLQFSAIFGGRQGQRLGWLGFILTAVLAPLGALLVQTAVSRSREYEADRLGAMICGNPLWLASALAKIQSYVEQTRNVTAERHPATAHMFIINPFAGRRADSLFATHPSTENRIAELEKLAAEMAAINVSDRDEWLLRNAPWRDNGRALASRPVSNQTRGPWG
jgi:heat shock protein HtpX